MLKIDQINDQCYLILKELLSNDSNKSFGGTPTIGRIKKALIKECYYANLFIY